MSENDDTKLTPEMNAIWDRHAHELYVASVDEQEQMEATGKCVLCGGPVFTQREIDAARKWAEEMSASLKWDDGDTP